MDPNRYIASKIGLAREMSDMSITTLARRAGMTPNVLSESLRVLPSFGIRVGGAIEVAAQWARLPVPTSVVSCVVRTR